MIQIICGTLIVINIILVIYTLLLGFGYSYKLK